MKLKLKYIFILHLLCLMTCFFGASAQENGIIKGVVMEKGTPTRITNAVVFNKTTIISVNSNDFGLFQIRAVIGDTLQIFKQDYLDVQVVVVSEKDILVHLIKGSTTLSQVNIYGQTKKQEMNDIKQEFRNKGSYYAGKPPLLSYVFTPLTAIYELFGRTPKNARRFGKYYTSELRQTEIDGFFNESKIQKHTDLKDKELEEFMLNYRPDYEVVKKWNEYDAIKYIKDSYEKYKMSTLKK
ncbi:hypothetical protein [Pedobacter sp. CG_S7]|uniref:hypothetical protein n=1 Tax=Pedobacter sp. CG_S7 TaxID=3143930 RepID=UPI003390952C